MSVPPSINAATAGQRWIVITSINRPTAALEIVSRLCQQGGWRAVVVGDTKTPADWNCPGVDFLSVEAQRARFGALAELIPYRHYCRKNLGYLHAIERGATLIVDTDDDNLPYDSFGHGIDRHVPAGSRLLRGPGWVNVYPHFVDKPGSPIWPRGLPLDEIYTTGTISPLTASVDCPIQQFLADNDPDVDAIYRLTTRGEFFFQRDASPVVLDRGCWVPFNSQNTVFFADAFPLLYLPCFVSFRMTDIWRSFVAQAAMWHMGKRVSFHAATVQQLRNEHDLTRDFADEVSGYLHNRKLGEALDAELEQLPAGMSMTEVVIALWKAMIRTEVVPERELPVVQAWLAALAPLVASPR